MVEASRPRNGAGGAASREVGVRPGATLLLLAAFALRLFRLGDANVWWDEGLAIWAVRKPLVEATLWTAGDVHPPLYFWTLWLWIRLAGQSEFAARFPTAIAGCLLVATAFALGHRLAAVVRSHRLGIGASRKATGLLAAALAAVSVFQVWWSMEMRMYMLAGLAVLAATYCLVRWLGTADDRDVRAGQRGHIRGLHALLEDRWLVAHHAAALAALLTVYLTAVTVVAFNLVVLAGLVTGSIGRRRLLRWLAAQCAAVALYVPWLALALPRMESWSSIREPASAGFVAELWATLIATGRSTHLAAVRSESLVFWGAVAVGAAALVLVARRRRDAPEGGRGESGPIKSGLAEHGRGLPVLLLALLMVLPPLAVWLATQPRSLFYSPEVEARYLVGFAAPVYVMVAWVVVASGRFSRWLPPLLAAAMLAPQLLHLPGYYAERRLKNDLYTMALGIWSQAEPNDVVVLVSGNRYPLFHYYYDRPWQQPAGESRFEYPAEAPPDWEDRPPVVDFPDHGSEPIEAHDWERALGRITGSYSRLWLVELERDLQDPNGRVQAWLNDRWPRVLSEGYGADALHLYAADGAPPRVTGLSNRFPVVDPPGAVMPADELNTTVFHRRQDGPPRLVLVPSGCWQLDEFRCAPEIARLEPEPRPKQKRGSSRREGYSAQTDGESLVRTRLRFAVDDRLPGEPTYLSESGAPEALANAIGTVIVRGTPPLVERDLLLPDGGFLQGAELLQGAAAGPAHLVGYGLSGQRASPGETLVLDLYWQVRPYPQLPTHSPTVFAHLIGPARDGSGERVWAGHDGPPSSGAWPWQLPSGATADPAVPDTYPGLGLIFDRHVLNVDPATPGGSYQLEVGLYDAATGERYPVAGPGADLAGRRLLLTEVTVRSR